MERNIHFETLLRYWRINNNISDIIAERINSLHVTLTTNGGFMKSIQDVARCVMFYFLAFGLAVLIAGCPARSLQPLFAEKDVVFNPLILGTWVNKGDVYTFRQAGEKDYEVVVRPDTSSNKGVDSVVYTVQLGKLGNSWFLDSSPEGDPRDFHLLAAHIISKFELQSADSFSIASLESDWLKKKIDDGSVTAAHVNRDGDIILTGATDELQQLVSRYADDSGAFPNPGEFVRVK